MDIEKIVHLHSGFVPKTTKEKIAALRAKRDERIRRQAFLLDSIRMSIKDPVIHPENLMAIRNELNRLIIDAYDKNAMVSHCCLGAPDFEMNDEARALFNDVVHEDVIAVWDNPIPEE